MAIAVVTAATYSRLTRGAMLDVLGEDYYSHRPRERFERKTSYLQACTQNFGSPVVTQFGIDLGTLLGGAIVTEQVFGLPGLGREVVQAIITRGSSGSHRYHDLVFRPGCCRESRR